MADLSEQRALAAHKIQKLGAKERVRVMQSWPGGLTYERHQSDVPVESHIRRERRASPFPGGSTCIIHMKTIFMNISGVLERVMRNCYRCAQPTLMTSAPK